MSGVYKDEQTNEWFYPENGYILSETDAKGIIIYVNELFCEIAGYKAKELLGQPHNIIRHSDMPKVAFKSLWDDIQSKGFWSGYVKNLRKDGGYYWVYATVLRKIASDGTVTYLSVRTKPSRAKVQESEALYKTLR